MIDKCVIVPISACVFATVVSPLLVLAAGVNETLQSRMLNRPENRIVWPALATISIILAVRTRSRLSRLSLPPHIVCLLAYLAFAGASVLWAFAPELSFIRFVQQVMIITSIVLPAMLAARTADMMRGMFLCFAFASILNVFFVLGRAPITMGSINIGYSGYFSFKNYLGEFAGIALILSLHEMLYPGLRRALGIIVVVIATLLLSLSKSKTSLGLALFAPFLAGLTLIAVKIMRISPAVVLVSIIGLSASCYAVLSSVFDFNINDVSQFLFGDPTLTKRTWVWDFALQMIARRPLLGWGYQSFWLAGPEAPSVVEAPGWIKTMPHAHNGYLDTMLEMGLVGLALLVIFIIATLHAVGRVAKCEPARAWLVLSLALFIIISNGLESTWMHAFDMLWVVFAMLAAEIGRYWEPVRLVGRSPAGFPLAARPRYRPRPACQDRGVE
jgi:O-antigen ligase